MAAAGLIPLVVGCAVNYAKFGVPFGVSNFDQVFTQVNAYRRRFLASNHNAEFGVHFIPSTVLAYLRPDGLRFPSVFPFITLPGRPTHLGRAASCSTGATGRPASPRRCRCCSC